MMKKVTKTKIDEECKYHLLIGNLSYDNFERLIEEEQTTTPYKEEGVVRWKISSENATHINKIKAGDICYFYYSNLPDGTSRIILRGEVLESDYPKQNRPLIYDDKRKILGIKVKLSPVALTDQEKYSYKNLKEIYNFDNNFKFQGPVNLTKNYKKLLDDLISDSRPKQHLAKVNKYFNENYCLCEFRKDGKRNHETFIEKNGFYYIELHHLVERNQVKKNIDKFPDIEKYIENENNTFRLCPTCHKEIHLGKDEVKKEKIAYLYNLNKSYFDSNFNELKHGLSTLEWLYKIYNIDDIK